MNSLKILVIQDTDWLRRNPIQQHQLFERMSLRGHKIHIIDYPIEWFLENSKRQFLSVRKMKIRRTSVRSHVDLIRPPILPLPILSRLSSMITHSFWIYKELKYFKPDCVFLLSITTGSVALLLSKIFKIPIFYYSMDNLHELQPFPSLRNIARFFESFCIKTSDVVLIVNKRLKKHVLKLGCPAGIIDLLPMGIDAELLTQVDRRNKIRKKLGVKTDEILIMFMGYLYRFSGLKEVILSIKKYNRVNLRFLILGSGEKEFELELSNLIRDENLEYNIILHGQVPFSSIPGYLSATDIGLLPMIYNNITKDITPIKVYEYLAASKPVIMTKLPGVYEEFHDVPGAFFVQDAKEIISIVPEELEKVKEWRELAKNGSSVVKERYNWPIVVNRCERIVFKNLRGKRR